MADMSKDMRYDVGLTLAKIHNNDVEALIESVEEIIDVALVRIDESELLKLRFITPNVSLDEWLQDERCANYKLTQPDEHYDGLEYVVVSYCWQFDQSKEGLPPIPNYYIHDSDSPANVSRRNKCPDLVLHRAIQYARKRECPYIWIDQECINQEDKEDVEKHLKIMHRVYRESHWPIAILSVQLPDVDTVKAARNEFEGMFDDDDPSTTVLKMKQRADAHEIIAKDRWFSRAWVFQERSCAKRLVLLLPPCKGSDGQPLATEDYQVDYSENLDPFSRFSPLRFCFLQVIKFKPWKDSKNFVEANSASENMEVQKRYDPAYSLSIASRTFHKLKDCGCSLVSDRLTILGNICDLDCKLLSNRLRDPKYSYNTCAFALFVANNPFSRKRRAGFIKELCQTCFDDPLTSVLGRCLELDYSLDGG